MLIAVLIVWTTSSFAVKTTPVALVEAVKALKNAHDTHRAAIETCHLSPEHEIGWDYIEKEVANLASVHNLPPTSETVGVLSKLRIERRALMHDFVGCAFKLSYTRMSTSVLSAMDSLDDAASDLEDSIHDRTWNMEKGLAYCKTHLAN